MKYFVCLQAGHQNAKNNCDATLAKSTGAPGEMEFNIRIRDRLSQILLSKKNPDGSDAFTVQLVDACFNCDPKANDQDYALFLAIHYDADVYGEGGGFVDFPEPSTDGATAESQRIVKCIEDEYFKHAEITNKPNRRNAKTKYYYMWKFLSAKTPCALIECGVGQNAHDKVLLADTDRIANAIARGICKAFNVAFDAVQPPQPDTYGVDAHLKSMDLTNDGTKAKVKATITAIATKNGDAVAQTDKSFEAEFTLSLPTPPAPADPEVVVKLDQKINFGQHGTLTLDEAIKKFTSLNETISALDGVIKKAREIKSSKVFWWVKYGLWNKLFA